MKYKLINSVTKIETICDKVTIDGFDYYVSNEIEDRSGKIAYINNDVYKNQLRIVTTAFGNENLKDCKKVIATTNSNIDIPKVVDEVEELSEKFIGCKYEDIEDSIDQIGYDSFKRGYNKSQETYPFSEEDIIEFAEWLIKRLPPQYDCDTTTNYIPQVMINDEKQLWTKGHGNRTEFYTTKELLQLWKEQKHKIVYYNE